MSGPRGLILAAPASGSGKTTVAVGLMAALRARGVNVAPAKVGPDYIDPGFHAAAASRPSFNLDPWAMRPATIARVLQSLADADIVLCEAAMGLFDGIDPEGTGSAADLAARLGWPVVLVVDVSGQGASVAALVEGFARHRADVNVAGVILNRVASERHRALLAGALERVPAIALFGAVARDPALALPSRHLGLVPAGEMATLAGFVAAAAARVGAAVDLDGLCALGRPALLPDAPAASGIKPLGQRIAVARDDAFVFAYPALLEAWRRDGAVLSAFSPLADEPPAADADAVFLPGGYPELHAGRLAAAAHFLAGLRAAAQAGAWVYGECGGYMVLGDGLVDANGTRHAMAGLLGLETSFACRRLHLGYRSAALVDHAILGPAGTPFRGHEFHYASVVREDGGQPLFVTADAAGKPLGHAGARRGKLMGSFLHLIDQWA